MSPIEKVSCSTINPPNYSYEKYLHLSHYNCTSSFFAIQGLCTNFSFRIISLFLTLLFEIFFKNFKAWKRLKIGLNQAHLSFLIGLGLKVQSG